MTILQHEVSVLRHLRHPNILPCLASIVQGKEVVLVSPLMEFGSAKDLITSHFNEGLPEIAIAAILKEVLTALGHLHSQVHIVLSFHIGIFVNKLCTVLLYILFYRALSIDQYEPLTF